MGVGKLSGGGSEGGWLSSPNSGCQPSELVSKSMTQGGGLGSEGGYGFIPSPKYHNPDPLVCLIGPANESPVEVEGIKITSLVDSGVCMSAMVKSFADELQLEIKPLSTILDIEGTGGGRVPYHGYVECRLKLPQIKKFDLDVLMLVLDDSPYGMRVPVLIGSLHIDMAIGLAMEAEMQKLNHKWERAKMAHLLCMGSLTVNEKSDKSELNLDEIQGSVHLT